jgi:photosystem II stability/assembly factor-like uncharacterized protein
MSEPSTTSTPTSDAASTTTTIPLKVDGFLAQSVSFVTADDAFVLGVVGCSSGACLAVRHTSDGGRTWSPVPAPPTALATTGTSGVLDLHFADALDGWAYGPVLWATHDGGVEWQSLDLGGGIVAMASGSGEVYALVEPCATDDCAAPGHLYRSPAGRNSWSLVPGVSGTFDETSGNLVIEGNTVFLLTGGPTPQLLVASDGLNFSSLPIPCVQAIPGDVVPFLPGGLAASDPSDISVVCLGGIGAGNQLKQAFVSHDGGRTFLRLPDPPTGGDGAELAMPAPAVLLLGTASAATSLFRTTASNEAWSISSTFAGGGVGLSGLAFVDPEHGAFIFGPASEALTFLRFPNAPSGLGQLYLTDDDGSTWHPDRIPA